MPTLQTLKINPTTNNQHSRVAQCRQPTTNNKGKINYSASLLKCRYMLHFLYTSAASAASPLYKAKGAFFCSTS